MKAHRPVKLEVPPVDKDNWLLDLPVPTTDGHRTVRELTDRYYNDEYGAAMRAQPLRFEVNYGYDREQMLADLGPDACPVGHQQQYLDILQIVIDEEIREGTLFTPNDEELAILAFGGGIHDIGESIHKDVKKHTGGKVLGDKPAGTKTEADKILESRIRYFFYHKKFNDVKTPVIDRVEAIVSHKDTTLLHELYEAAHNLQTLTTVRLAEQAYELASIDIGDEPNVRTAALKGIGTVVKQRTIGDLRRHRYLTAVDAAFTSQDDTSDECRHVVTPENSWYHRFCCAA